MNYYGKISEFTPDKLFAGEEIPVLTVPITVAAGHGILKRGTVLCKNAGEYQPVASTADIPEAILTDDCDTTEEIFTAAYITGLFNKAALIFCDGLSYDDFELELRKLGIFAKAVKEN